MELKEILAEIVRENLNRIPLYQQGVRIIQEVQENLAALSSKSDEKELTSLKIGTILILSVLKKAVDDQKRPKDYQSEDWKDIAEDISRYAILPDGQQYSIFIFELYSGYIRTSAEGIRTAVSDDSYNEIVTLAEEIDDLTARTEGGEITEIEYIEQCLWLSLEGMLKLLAAIPEALGDAEKSEYAKAVAMFAMEKARLTLYERENKQLDLYLVEQAMLDDELEEKYRSFAYELDQEYNSLNHLLEEAFAPDFKNRLRSSADLARAVGVPEKDILKTVDDVDEYFL